MILKLLNVINITFILIILLFISIEHQFFSFPLIEYGIFARILNLPKFFCIVVYENGEMLTCLGGFHLNGKVK